MNENHCAPFRALAEERVGDDVDVVLFRFAHVLRLGLNFVCEKKKSMLNVEHMIVQSVTQRKVSLKLWVILLTFRADHGSRVFINLLYNSPSQALDLVFQLSFGHLCVAFDRKRHSLNAEV